MPQKPLYPEGTEQMNVSVPSTLKARLDEAANARRVSRSQLVTLVLESWLDTNGSLLEEPVAIA